MARNSKLIKIWFKEQSNFKLAIAAIIFIALCYVLFGWKYDKEYNKEVISEIRLAQNICENSLKWVSENTKRLKMGHSDLRNIKINGKKVELEHVKYPEVIFLDSGIRMIQKNKKTATDLYCVVSDPRSSGTNYYYNYENRLWVNKVRFRR